MRWRLVPRGVRRDPHRHRRARDHRGPRVAAAGGVRRPVPRHRRGRRARRRAAAHLILATDRQRLADEYEQLSQIAPTLSWAEGYNQDDWTTTTTRVGEALGRADEAQAQLTRTNDAIAAAIDAHPQLAGLTFTLGPVTADGAVNTINSTADASAEFLAQLGMELSPTVTSLPSSGIPGRAVISPEELELLDADVLLLTFNTPEARTTLEANELFQRVPAVRDGRYVALDLPIALAIGFPSALSIRYGLEQVLPKVAAALA